MAGLVLEAPRSVRRWSAEAQPCLAAAAVQTDGSAVVRLDGAYSAQLLSVDDADRRFGAEWDELAACAASPNPFYERWNLRSAVKHLQAANPPELLLVFGSSKQPGAAARLCGLFPVVCDCNPLRLTRWTLWGHEYTFLRTPLIRRETERDVFAAMFDWIGAERSGPSLLDWGPIDGEGVIAQALQDVIQERRLIAFAADQFGRALLQRVSSWESIIGSELSNHHRRELRRLHRRLSEQGELSVARLRGGDELDEWRDAFLDLEASGWKGEAATALASSAGSRDYLDAIVNESFAAGRLQMLGLFLNDQPIAMKLNLLAAPGAFAFKIAYDERYAKFSPGVQLELENIRLMHEETDLEWMDSCARSNHFMINRLWSSRRVLQRLLVSTGSRAGNLCVGAYPLLRACKRSLRRPAAPPTNS